MIPIVILARKLKREGIQHILFEAQDPDAELNRLTGAGVTVLLHARFKGGGLS
jgi:hypothetical protein